MGILFLFNTILVLIDVGILILLKKTCKSELSKYLALLIIPIATILCHYSPIIYHHFSDGNAFEYVKGSPNLFLPIYPCNVVMWLCLVFGIVKNKNTKFGKFLIDYLFWFGIISSLIGMFANVDFIKNPTLANYDITESIVSHAILLLNSLALAVFGLVKVKLERNLLNIFISIIMMLFIGLYCNFLFEAIHSYDYAYRVNSMFLIHSPFDGVEFLKYPFIASIAIAIYFLIFVICEFIAYRKGNRWYNRIIKYMKKN